MAPGFSFAEGAQPVVSSGRGGLQGEPNMAVQ